MSPEKIKLLKELQELENKWSSDFLTHGVYVQLKCLK